MNIHLGNRTITTTTLKLMDISEGVIDGYFVNASSDTLIFLDINKENLEAAGGGYPLPPTRTIPVKYFRKMSIYVKTAAGSSVLGWLIIDK